MNAVLGRASAFVLALAFSVTAARAQTPAPASTSNQTQVPANAYGISGWQLQCNTQNNALLCQVLDTVAARANGAVIVSVSIRMLPDGKTPLLVVQTPLGVAVDDPVHIGLEGGSGQSLAFLTCLNGGCFARTPLNASLLSSMQTGKQSLRLSFTSLDNNFNKQTISISLALDGFAAAYAKLK